MRKMLELISVILPATLFIAGGLLHNLREVKATRQELQEGQVGMTVKISHLEADMQDVKRELSSVHTKVDVAKTMAEVNRERLTNLDR